MWCVRSIVFPIALAVIAQGNQPQTSKERFELLLKDYAAANGVGEMARSELDEIRQKAAPEKPAS
jgi:elongation factor P--beta-lysine ligase